MAGSGTDYQEQKGLPRNWPHGGDVEVSGGDIKSPAHNLHHLPHLLPHIWMGCGTGTATLEAKLLQKLAALREEVLYVIFLDMHKAYDALDR